MPKILQEINKKASDSVSSALSKLAGKEVDASFVNYEMRDVKTLIQTKGSERMIVSIYLPIKVDVRGVSAFILYEEDALKFSDLLMKRRPGTARSLSDMDISALKEAGNIVVGNYLKILSNELKVEIIEGMPNYTKGMYGAILEQIISDVSKEFSEVIAIEIQFAVSKVVFKGFLYMYLLLSREEIKKLLDIS